jgi:hypothetical protein
MQAGDASMKEMVAPEAGLIEPTGKARGGHARARLLTPAERSAIAKRAAKARWADVPLLKATHGDPNHPLQIGDLEIPCYVLEDGQRVLTLKGMVGSIGMSIGTAGGGEGDRLVNFATGKAVSPFISADLLNRMKSPIRFRVLRTGVPATGYPATILPDLCDAVLTARKAGGLLRRQQHIADQCEILVRGFARVGIIALIDEVTGYQHDRASDALAKILEAFIAKELQQWVRTFPSDYYQHLFRLRGLNYPTDSVQRPQYFGVLTNDIVYKRLAPGVLAELKKITPRRESGRLKHKYFQRLTHNIGYPKLREHLGAVVAIMRLSDSYHDFIRKMDQHYPRYGETMALPMDYRADKDSGLGI